jgi:hypothetical protein
MREGPFMKTWQSGILASALALALAGCAQQGGDKAPDKPKDSAAAGAAAPAADTSQAASVPDKTPDVIPAEIPVPATPAEGTDAWILATIRDKFDDEILLEGGSVTVDCADHVVTLKGVVTSAAGKTRAETVARSVKGVTQVVNQLVAK